MSYVDNTDMGDDSPPPYGTRPLYVEKEKASSDVHGMQNSYYPGIPTGQPHIMYVEKASSDVHGMQSSYYPGIPTGQPNVVYVAAPPVQQPFQQPFSNRADMPTTAPSAYATVRSTNEQPAFEQARTERDLARLQAIQGQIMTQVSIKMAGLCCNMVILVFAVFTLGIALVCAVGTIASSIQASKEIVRLADEAAAIAVANPEQRVQMVNNAIQGRRPSCFMI